MSLVVVRSRHPEPLLARYTVQWSGTLGFLRLSEPVNQPVRSNSLTSAKASMAAGEFIVSDGPKETKHFSSQTSVVLRTRIPLCSKSLGTLLNIQYLDKIWVGMERNWEDQCDRFSYSRGGGKRSPCRHRWRGAHRTSWEQQATRRSSALREWPVTVGNMGRNPALGTLSPGAHRPAPQEPAL